MIPIADFFMSINIQTTIFLVGIALLIQSWLLWFQSKMIREYNGIRTAAGGSFLFGLGMLLTSLRGSLGDFFSIIVANYLVILGIAAHYVAVSKFLQMRVRKTLFLIAVVPALLLFPYYTYLVSDFTMRVILSSLGSAILIGAMAVMLFKQKHSNFFVSARFLAYVCAIYSFVLSFRIIGFYAFPTDGMLAQFPFSIVHSIIAFGASIMWPIGFMMMVSHRLQSDLNELATVDVLTRVANRRAMIPILESEFARFSRTHTDFSILLVDLDYFKEVNDQYGHAAGDIVLYEVAQTIKNALRKQDVISRWGGEEFLILLPSTNITEALEIGERVRSTVEQSHYELGGLQIELTVSIGVGNTSESNDVTHIYKSSDAALYKAKLTRNAVAQNTLKII